MMHARIGVYLFSEDSSPSSSVDEGALARYAAGVDGVSFVQRCSSRSQFDPEVLSQEIARHGLRRLVLAGHSPGAFKPAFTRALVLAGGDPDEVYLAAFRRHGVADQDSTQRAQAVLACAVHGVPFDLVDVGESHSVNPKTLIVGGGVAGIQAALEIANAGKKVILVERSGTIGGHMAMFDKTFPTLDCAACILTPKMVSVGQHEMIELLTLSEILRIDGTPGHYRVTIRKGARRVDSAACSGCSSCAEWCPVSVPSEFDQGISMRKAIYMPFPQAVPNTYLIDAEACTYIQSGGKKCGACVRKCSKECIDLDARDEELDVEVGNIIFATGYETFDAKRIERYGYGIHPNVLTALEFERLTNASGPTGGRIVLKTLRHDKKKKTDIWALDPDGPAPRSVAIIHCVGSRDQNYNRYCSRVCCMYSLKFAHLVREKLHDANVYEFYIDMRAFGKGYEEFFERIKSEDVFVVRGRSAKVEARENGLVLRGEDIVGDRVVEFPVDMVVLAVGLQPRADAASLAAMAGIERDEDGWFREWCYNGDPTGTARGGIYVAGVCQGPKDIPDTVAQASAVAARVLKSIVSGRGDAGRQELSLEEIEARAVILAASAT